jgi:hypothetical protein
MFSKRRGHAVLSSSVLGDKSLIISGSPRRERARNRDHPTAAGDDWYFLLCKLVGHRRLPSLFLVGYLRTVTGRVDA